MTYLSPEWRQKLLNAGFPASELKLGVAEEILGRLPDILEERFSLIIFRDYNREEKKQEWCLMYEHIPNRMPLYSESADTLANAASAMYVFLSKNNLLPTT